MYTGAVQIQDLKAPYAYDTSACPSRIVTAMEPRLSILLPSPQSNEASQGVYAFSNYDCDTFAPLT
jgi:hypothetical protein